MDAFYRNKCKITELDYAVTVSATVVSRPIRKLTTSPLLCAMSWFHNRLP